MKKHAPGLQGRGAHSNPIRISNHCTHARLEKHPGCTAVQHMTLHSERRSKPQPDVCDLNL